MSKSLVFFVNSNNVQMIGAATQNETKKYAVAGGIAEEVLGSMYAWDRRRNGTKS